MQARRAAKQCPVHPTMVTKQRCKKCQRPACKRCLGMAAAVDWRCSACRTDKAKGTQRFQVLPLVHLFQAEERRALALAALLLASIGAFLLQKAIPSAVPEPLATASGSPAFAQTQDVKATVPRQAGAVAFHDRDGNVFGPQHIFNVAYQAPEQLDLAKSAEWPDLFADRFSVFGPQVVFNTRSLPVLDMPTDVPQQALLPEEVTAASLLSQTSTFWPTVGQTSANALKQVTAQKTQQHSSAARQKAAASVAAAALPLLPEEVTASGWVPTVPSLWSRDAFLNPPQPVVAKNAVAPSKLAAVAGTSGATGATGVAGALQHDSGRSGYPSLERDNLHTFDQRALFSYRVTSVWQSRFDCDTAIQQSIPPTQVIASAKPKAKPKKTTKSHGTWLNPYTTKNPYSTFHLSHYPKGSKLVTLSFDGDHLANQTDVILAILKEKNVRATVFLTGTFIKKYPRETRAIAAAGHEIGNHTYSHPRLTTYGDNQRHQTHPDMDRKTLQEELQRTAAVYEEVTGQKMAPFWRAPYGEHNPDIRTWAAEEGYLHVGWTRGFDSIDWLDQPQSRYYWRPQKLKQKLLGRMADLSRTGAITLFHLGSKRIEADQPHHMFAQFIDEARALGYRFVTVEEGLAYPLPSSTTAAKQVDPSPTMANMLPMD